MTLVPASIIVIAILFAVFFYYPPPQLTANLAIWKERGNVLEFKDQQIFYLDEQGKGIAGTIICLHGFPSSSYDWKKIMPGLKNIFNRVVVFDFLGFGFSDKPISHVYTIAEQADITVALLSVLEETEVHIMSHDYGDTVALELLSRMNDHGHIGDNIRLRSLSMLNGGIFVETHHPRILQKILLYPVIGPIAAQLTYFHLFQKGFNEIFGSNKPTSEEMWEFWVNLRYNNGNAALSSIIDFLVERKKYNERWVGALKSTKVKVQMIYGPADPVNPPIFSLHYRKTVPQHEIVELESNIGHYPQWEDPETVLREYFLFIDKLNK